MKPINLSTSYTTNGTTATSVAITSQRTVLRYVFPSPAESPGDATTPRDITNNFISLRDGTSGGDEMCQIRVPSNEHSLSMSGIDIPLDGILFPDGIFCVFQYTDDTEDAGKRSSITLFYT